jgi:hypothetical protein
MTVTTGNENLTLTDRRKGGLRQVAANRVTYDPSRAAWMIDGHNASGWDWRTFSEMQQAGWIKWQSATRISEVVLTEEGKKINNPPAD